MKQSAKKNGKHGLAYVVIVARSGGWVIEAKMNSEPFFITGHEGLWIKKAC